MDIDDSASASSPPLSVDNESTLGTSTTPLPQTTQTTPHTTKGKGRVAPKRKREDSEEVQLLHMACRELSTTEAVKDELDCFGMSVTHALRDMPRDQMLHAKKLISEVIYEGQLHNLSRASTVTAVPVPAIPMNTSIAGPSHAPGEYSTTPDVYRGYHY